jgi:prevent-host-death family protein
MHLFDRCTRPTLGRMSKQVYIQTEFGLKVGECMRDVNVAESIVPLGEFKAKAAQILRDLSEHNEPIIITQNGRAAAVVLSPAAFEEFRERQRVLEAVAEGIADLDEGRVVDHQDVRAWLESWGSESERDAPQ